MSKRSYEQYCGLARALDVVGARWSLLIVRQLMVGPARYTKLLDGLPGIATNLLAARLRELEEAGIVARTLDVHSNGVAYTLTPWGSELRDTVAALVKWSIPLMVSGPNESDSFRGQWLAVALDALLDGRRANEPTTIGLGVDDTIVAVRIDETGAHVDCDGDERPDTVLRGAPEVVLGLASGSLTVDEAVAAGELRGPKANLVAVFGVR